MIAAIVSKDYIFPRREWPHYQSAPYLSSLTTAKGALCVITIVITIIIVIIADQYSIML